MEALDESDKAPVYPNLSFVPAGLACLPDSYRQLIQDKNANPKDITKLIYRIATSNSADLANPVFSSLLHFCDQGRLKMGPDQAVIMLILDHVFEQIKVFDLQPAVLNQWFGWLKNSIYVAALLSEDFFTNEQNPVRNFLRQIKEGSGFVLLDDPSFAAAKNAIQEKIRAVNADQGQELRPVLDLAHHIEKLIKKQDNRSDRMAQRVVDVESGLFNASHAKLKVMDRINHVAENKALPMVFQQFIKTHWRDSLVITCLRDGVDGPEWAEHDAITVSMIEVFAGQLESMQQLQKLLREKAVFLKSIETHLLTLEHDIPRLRAVMSDLEAELEKIINGEEIAAVIYEPFPGDSAITLSDEQLQKVQATFVKGRAFEYQDQKKKHLCRIAAVLGDYEAILFVNFSGQKLLIANASEIYFLYEAGRMRPLEEAPVFDHALQQVLDRLANATHPQETFFLNSMYTEVEEITIADGDLLPAPDWDSSAEQDSTSADTPAKASVDKIAKPTEKPSTKAKVSAETKAVPKVNKATKAAAAKQAAKSQSTTTRNTTVPKQPAQVAPSPKPASVQEPAAKTEKTPTALDKTDFYEAKEKAQQQSAPPVEDVSVSLPVFKVEEATEAELEQEFYQESEEIDMGVLPESDSELAVATGDIVKYIEGEKSVRLKVAAILSSSNKVIFVDDLGRKYKEMSIAEVELNLSDKTLEIVRSLSGFESTLEKVVTGIRSSKRD